MPKAVCKRCRKVRVLKGAIRSQYCPGCTPRAVNWFKNKSGYVTIRLGNKHHYQHRLIFEVYLERRLKPTEHIHHLNGIREDNRIENLVMCSPAEHAKHHMNSVRAKQMSILGHKKRWNYGSNL